MLGMPNEYPGTERRIIHMAPDGDAEPTHAPTMKHHNPVRPQLIFDATWNLSTGASA